MWDKITYPFLNFNDATAEIYKWISNSIPHFTGRVNTYPRRDWSETMLVKGAMEQIIRLSLKECWFIVDWTIRNNKISLNLKQYILTVDQEYVFEEGEAQRA